MTTAATALVAGIFLCCLPAWCSAADGEMCYTSGSVAGIVIATVVVTIVVGGLAAAGVWYLWKQRTALASSGKKPGSVFFGSTENGCALENHPSEKSAIEGGKEAYAFDNPYFKDDETDLGKPNQDAAEKGEAGFREDNGEIKNSANKVSSGQKPKKSRPFSNITFPNVFHQASKKPRALDDSFIAKPLERVEVPLRGHDFTGLGFNICGNMRDGIFVKDVLHRGPASESGKIKAGDRIIGVRVSFSGMVYEDALTILSYASPYDVRLELEKTAEADRSRHLALQASSPATKTRLGSSSFRTGQRLFHPLYRSQSFDDLTQIGKDNNFRISNGTDAAVTACKGPYTNCPKRSQSIETAATPKPRVHMTPTNSGKKSSANSSTSSTESSSKREEIAKVSDEGSVTKASAESPKAKSARFHVENFLRQKKAPVVVQNTAISKEKREVLEATRQPSPEVPLKQPTHQEPEESAPDPAKPEEEDTVIKAEVQDDSRPTAPPRKSGVHVKRKAPAPPQKSGEATDTTETSAVVHRDAEDDSVSEMSQDVQPDQGESVELSGSQSTQALHYVKSDGIVEIVKENDVHSVSGESLPTSTEEADSGSSTKRKASSLGDLTKLDASGHKKSPVTTTILERAVSLDLQQQSLPEGNLVKQKMVLRAPTFEDPEDVGEEDFATLKNQPSGNLKRWEGSWSGLQEDAKTSEKEVKSEEIWTVSSTTVINGDTDDVLSMEERSTLIPFDPGFKREEEQQQTDSEPQDGGSSSIRITSTPIKKIIETESFFKNDVDLDDIPYLGDCSAIKDDQSSENTSATSSVSAGNPRPVTSPSATSPISLSIPIIKPDFSQYEKLPSPLSPVKPQTTESSSGPADDKKRHDSGSQSAEERALGSDSSTANSSYEPVFTTETASVLKTSNFVSGEDTSNNKSEITGTKIISALDIVNGNGFGAPSYSHYRTALEDELSESSTMETTAADSSSATDFSKKTTLAEISSIKVHSGAAGFAKTLIISTPIEGESISLNADLDSPPPQLEPPQ